MTLDDTLLEKLANWKPPGDGRHTFAFLDPESGTSAQIAVDRLDALSCQLWEIGLARSARATANEPSLGAWAQRVADKVTGLMEPLKVIEVDADRGQALLRSEAPSQKGDDLNYYEVLLHRTGSASVRRYKGSRQPVQRQQAGFVLTREALAKLVRDIAG